MAGITREKLIEKIENEESIHVDDELVSFIPLELLNKWWRKFGGIFLQRENKREKTIEVKYCNDHYYHSAVKDITDVSIDSIIKIMKCGLETGIDLFVSVTQKAEPIIWKENIYLMEQKEKHKLIEGAEKKQETENRTNEDTKYGYDLGIGREIRM